MRNAALALSLAMTVGCLVQESVVTSSLRVGGAPPDASVTIDDQYVGVFGYVASRGVALPPGKHRITVEKPGYFVWDRLVEAKGDPIALRVELTKIPN